jgi:FKBP-type peptidyl-prolyl cis-trans isomerase FkpA
MRASTFISVVFVLAAASGCATPRSAAIHEISFAPETGVVIAAMEQPAPGLYVRDLRTGDGPVVSTGQMVRIHYVGWLPDGTQFDGLAPPSEPLEFRLGAGEVIAGWDQGIVGMRAGGQRQMVVAPQLGYGTRRIGRIPPNSTLVFIVELVYAR